MKVVDLSLFPTTIDVTLYKYNYLDNKLWTQLKNQVDYIEVNDTSFIVSRDQLEAILLNHYAADINKIKSTGSKFFHTQVNTVYFLWMLTQEMTNLQYIKITKSTDKSYTRLLITPDNEKTIEFDFKLLTITIRLTDIFDQSEINLLNETLYNLGILDEDEPYTRINAVEIISALDDALSAEEDELPDEMVDAISELLEIFTHKIERDNPLTLLVTDY